MALDFNGTTAVVDHGDIATLDAPSALSIACWLNYDTALVNDAFIEKQSATTNGFRVGTRGAGADFAMNIQDAGDNYGRVVGGITEDTWAHWGIVFDGAGVGNAGRLQIYKDGAAQSVTFVGTIPAAVVSSGAATLKMGKLLATSAFADCALAHIKVWTAALTAAEIANEMHSYRPARTANLVLWAPYDDGTSAIDYSGSGNAGSVTAATQVAGPPVAAQPAVMVL